jgi:hypothetical protein
MTSYSERKERKPRKDAFSMTGLHQAKLDKKNHPPIEHRYKELYGKWPTSSELAQAMPHLKKRKVEDDE